MTSHIGDPDNTQTMDNGRLEDLLQQYVTNMDNLQAELRTSKVTEEKQNDAGVTTKPILTETPQQVSIIYANEADVLNMALFGTTAAAWREANPDLKGNIRDYATINELICLSNMENINAVLINEGLTQRERLIKLNKIAIQQMSVLQEVESRKLLR